MWKKHTTDLDAMNQRCVRTAAHKPTHKPGCCVVRVRVKETPCAGRITHIGRLLVVGCLSARLRQTHLRRLSCDR